MADLRRLLRPSTAFHLRRAPSPSFRMASFRDGFMAYQLVNLETRMPLYRTCATSREIIEANRNLRQRGLPSRFLAAAIHPANYAQVA